MVHLTLIHNQWKQGQDIAPEEYAAQAQVIYDQYKIQDAELIDCHITLPDGYGIINCRINGEHKQIRF